MNELVAPAAPYYPLLALDASDAPFLIYDGENWAGVSASREGGVWHTAPLGFNVFGGWYGWVGESQLLVHYLTGTGNAVLWRTGTGLGSAEAAPEEIISPTIIGDEVGCVDAVGTGNRGLVHYRRRPGESWSLVSRLSERDTPPFDNAPLLARAPSGALHLFTGSRSSTGLQWMDLGRPGAEIVTPDTLEALAVGVQVTPSGERPVALMASMTTYALTVATRTSTGWEARELERGYARECNDVTATEGATCDFDGVVFVPLEVLSSASGDVRLLYSRVRTQFRTVARCSGRRCRYEPDWSTRVITGSLMLATLEGHSEELTSFPAASAQAAVDARGTIHIVTSGVRYVEVVSE